MSFSIWLDELLDWLRSISKSVGRTGFLFVYIIACLTSGFLGFLQDAVYDAAQMTAWLANMLGQLRSVDSSVVGYFQACEQYIGVLNYLLPLDQAMYAAGVMITFMAFAFSYRFVKSWIPTVN